jgi:hypothetical protein
MIATPDLPDLPNLSPATSAALGELASSLSEHLVVGDLERIRSDLAARLLVPAHAELARTVNERLAAAVAPVLAQLAASLGAGLDETIAGALRSINRADLEAAVAAASRDITESAAITDAIERSGYRSVVYHLASQHHGYVTTAMAEAVGVPPVEVRKLAYRGGLSNVARGLYRIDGIDGGERAPYAEAVLRVGEDAHLVGDSVLAFHDLALVNPQRIAVGTPRRVRRDLPDHIKLVHVRIDPADLTEYDGVRSATVERAIKDSIGSVMPERLAEATRNAANEGLLRRRAADVLLAAIEAAA